MSQVYLDLTNKQTNEFFINNKNFMRRLNKRIYSLYVDGNIYY